MATTPESWVIIDIAASAALLIAWMCSTYLNGGSKQKPRS